MPILVKSIQGRGYPLHVKTKTSYKLSDEGVLEFDIFENEYTHEVIDSITKMWTVTHVEGPNDKREYVVVLTDRSSVGDRLSVHVKAKEKHIDDLNTKRVYEKYTGSFTGKKLLDIAFRKSGYTYKLLDKVAAVEIETVGAGDSRWEIIKDAMDKFTLEYDYDPKKKLFTFQTSVQKDAKYFINTRINANNIKIEEDATQCYTFIRGYGDYTEEDGTDGAGLIMEFTHPLAELIGKREAPPIMDGRVKKETTMKGMLESEIAASLTTSLSLDFVNMPDKFKEADPKIGDVVRVFDTTTSVNDDMRIVEINTTRDPYNKVISQDVVFGDFRIREKYMKNLNSAANYVRSLGRLNTSNAKKNGIITKEQIEANSKATSKVLSATEGLGFSGEGIGTKESEGGNGAGLFLRSDGLYFNKGKGSNVLLANRNGLNTDSVQTATQDKNGMMSKEDKAKLDGLSSLQIVGDDNKTYKLVVVAGKLEIQEV